MPPAIDSTVSAGGGPAPSKGPAARATQAFYFFSILVKGIDGALETLAGLFFLLAKPSYLNHLFVRYLPARIATDPDDWIARTVRSTFEHLSGAGKWFAAGYLLGHGILKVLIVAALLKREKWAFLTALVTLLIFLVLEIARLFERFSVGLVLLTVFDAAVAVVIWREYRTEREAGPAGEPHAP